VTSKSGAVQREEGKKEFSYSDEVIEREVEEEVYDEEGESGSDETIKKKKKKQQNEKGGNDERAEEGEGDEEYEYEDDDAGQTSVPTKPAPTTEKPKDNGPPAPKPTPTTEKPHQKIHPEPKPAEKPKASDSDKDSEEDQANSGSGSDESSKPAKACKAKPPKVIPDNKKWCAVSCALVCKNADKKEACRAPKTWNDDDCKCTDAPRTTPGPNHKTSGPTKATTTTHAPQPESGSDEKPEGEAQESDSQSGETSKESKSGRQNDMHVIFERKVNMRI
jgi:hypothetical protein